MSTARLSRLDMSSTRTLVGGRTTPFCVQPSVPELMPKVWLPEVPLVVTARICGAMPFWPSNSIVPSPQPALLAVSSSWARAAGVAKVSASTAGTISVRMRAISSERVQLHIEAP